MFCAQTPPIEIDPDRLAERLAELRAVLTKLDPGQAKPWRLEIFDDAGNLKKVYDLKTGQPINLTGGYLKDSTKGRKSAQGVRRNFCSPIEFTKKGG